MREAFSVLLPSPRSRPYLLGTFVHAGVHGMLDNSPHLLCFLHGSVNQDEPSPSNYLGLTEVLPGLLSHIRHG